MIFLPIVSRELRVASRRRATYWVRTGAVLLAVALGAWLVIVMQGEPQRDLALGLFYLLTGGALTYAVLSGLRTTADCLSEEKRDGTLGLLFLTDLRGYDVVLGKLMANSVNALYSVVAVVPMLAIPLLLGGVTPGEFARMALLSVNALFFSLAVGIAVSAMSRSASRATLGAVVVVLFFTGVLPACDALLVVAGKTRAPHAVFLLPSVGFSYYRALDAVYKGDPGQFWYSMAAVHGLGWGLLTLASLVAPHTWQDRPAGAQWQRWGERWKLWSYGDPEERARFRRRLLDSNPFYWLAARARIKPALVWGFLALIGCGWAWGLAKGGRAWLAPDMYVTTGLLLNFALRCWFAAEATQPLAAERKAGTLEMLLATPLSVSQILRGQRQALVRQFSGPVVVVLLVEALFLVANLKDNPGPDLVFVTLFYLAGMSMLVVDFWALYWVGMWQGLSARNQSRATSTTLGQILILPWVVIAAVLLLFAIATLGGATVPGGGEGAFLSLWFVVGLTVDVVFALAAWRKLQTRFRQVAQQRYSSRVGFWAALFNR
jgi:ABC-type transport system involved in multi-copper enzyme maturation permease subunit